MDMFVKFNRSSIDDRKSRSNCLCSSKKTGGQSEVVEFSKSAMLLLCSLLPTIEFNDRSFLFTGTFAFGSRALCKQAIAKVGGTTASGVSRKLDYLVVGTYVTDSWKRESFVNKIKKAVEYRESGVPMSIVSEEYWVEVGGFCF